MTEFNSSIISVWVPSTNSKQEQISAVSFQQRCIKVEAYLIGLFGGSTTTPTSTGKWIDDNGIMIPEKVKVVSAVSFDLATPKQIGSLDCTLKYLRIEWGQYCILRIVQDSRGVDARLV